MRKSSLTLALFAATLSGVASTAWASGEHSGGHADANAADVERTISVEAGDMWFDPEEMDIAPGETVQFDITNTGSIEHEFVIGDKAAQEAHREMMQDMGGSHGEGGHGGHGGHDMAEGEHGGQMPAVTIAAGETQSLIWTAPENVESLEYACNIPGHYESGMYGTLNL